MTRDTSSARALNAHYYHVDDKSDDPSSSSSVSAPHCPPSFEQVSEERLEAPVAFRKPYTFLDRRADHLKKAITGNHRVEACFVKHRVPFLVPDYLTSADVPAFELAGEIFNLALRNVIRLHGTAYGGFLSGSASSGSVSLVYSTGYIKTFDIPTNIVSVNLVMGCPNARAGVGIVEEKTLRATKFRPLR